MKAPPVTYARFNRAVKEAVKLINADTTNYPQYYIDYHKAKDPEIGERSLSDLRAGRIMVCDPAPIPQNELERTTEGVKSWGMLEETESPLNLVNVLIQGEAHRPAAE